MSRYQELQESLHIHLKEVDAYWDGLRYSLTEVVEAFSSFLELPSPLFKNSNGEDEFYIKLGIFSAGKFTKRNALQLPINGNALEFAISLSVLTKAGVQTDMVVPLTLSRQADAYTLTFVNSGESIFARDRDFTEFAEAIFKAIRSDFDRRP